MRVTINTRLGPKTFFAPDLGGYVRLEEPGQPGTLASQICDGGEFTGDALSCGASSDSLERIARRWWRQRRAQLRANGLHD